MKDIREAFNKKIEENGQNKRWFWRKFVPEMSYYTMMNQVNSYSPICEDLKIAMKKYLYNNE